MKEKLNLTIEPHLIKSAKRLARSKEISVSRLFEELIEERLKAQQHHDVQNPTGWLEDFHKRNEEKLSKIEPKDIDIWMKERSK